MSEEFLASGFADIDASGDQGFYSHCLRLIDSLPYYKKLKLESYRRLKLGPGLSVLDVGCGLGDDLFRIAHLVAPDGKVVGMDSSSAMVSEALSCVAGHSVHVDILAADVWKLPFEDASFDRVRIDRTLQHIANPGKAIGEILRVLKPGGLAVAYDNDWGTFSISSQNREVTRLVEDEWRNLFVNPWIGDLVNQTRQKSFQCSLTAYLVAGKRPVTKTAIIRTHNVIPARACPRVSLEGLSGNPWFDRACPEYVSHFDRLSVTRIEGLTMTVTLSLSKGGCPIKNFGHDDLFICRFIYDRISSRESRVGFQGM